MKTFLQGLIFGIFAFLAPIKGLMILTMLFVGFDTIIGIYTSMKTGHDFSSTRLFGLAVKTFFYAGSIMLAFMIDSFILGGTAFGVKLLSAKLATIIWCWIEITSINEKSMMLGNRSIWTILRDFFKRAKAIKDDLKNITQ